MGWILALVMGGIMGWLASKVMNRDADMGIIMNVIVGCIGSIIGRFFLGGLLGGGRLRDSAFDPMTLLTSFIGAVVLLGVVNLIKRGTVR
ncbi:MAG: GlsB/YeaQ/YmgE family stress response membrane protein [Sphingomonadales bacterium]|nr:GlsB/YeaQ/YmgE family stress response membrane protein [Sphingomonadales bacterium]